MITIKSMIRFSVVLCIISLLPQALYAGDGIKHYTHGNERYYSYADLGTTKSDNADATKEVMAGTYTVDDYTIFNNWPPEEPGKDSIKTHLLYSPEDYHFRPVEDRTIQGELVPTGTGKELDGRTPIILVHGWQGGNGTATPYEQTDVELSAENYWKNFIEFFTQYHNLNPSS